MFPDTTTGTDGRDASGLKQTRLAGGAFVVGAVLFLVGGAITIEADPPPSTAPVLGMVSHALWFFAITLLALGAVTLLRWIEGLRTGLAGYLATGTLGLGVLLGLQWVAWAYVDVRASRYEEYELLVEPLMSSFGAGHLLMYAVLAGGGVGFLGWALVRTRLTHRFVAWAAVAIGTLTVLTATVSLLAVLTGGGDGHVLFNTATLLLPVLYGWAMIFGVDVSRRTPS